MRVNRGLLGWGVFFIVLGAVPLAVRAGAIDESVVRRAWELWPLILIGIGLGLVLARTRLAVLGTLVVAVTFGLMGGALLSTGPVVVGGFGSCGLGTGSGGGQAFETRTGTFAGDATVSIDMNCGEVAATPIDGTGWSVAGTADDGHAPEITATDRRLMVQAPDRSGINLSATPSRWQVGLPREAAVSLDLSINAGSGTLDLSGMTVPAVDVSVNAGDARLDLHEAAGTERLNASVNAGSMTILLPTPAGTLTGDVAVNAGSAGICIPDGVALRVRSGDQPLGSVDVGNRGLVRSGDTWSTPGFEGAASRIDLTVSANLGSITLDPEDGCD